MQFQVFFGWPGFICSEAVFMTISFLHSILFPAHEITQLSLLDQSLGPDFFGRAPNFVPHRSLQIQVLLGAPCPHISCIWCHPDFVRHMIRSMACTCFRFHFHSTIYQQADTMFRIASLAVPAGLDFMNFSIGVRPQRRVGA